MEQCHASWVELQGFRLIYKINTNKNKCFQTFFNKNFVNFFFHPQLRMARIEKDWNLKNWSIFSSLTRYRKKNRQNFNVESFSWKQSHLIFSFWLIRNAVATESSNMIRFFDKSWQKMQNYSNSTPLNWRSHIVQLNQLIDRYIRRINFPYFFLKRLESAINLLC